MESTLSTLDLKNPEISRHLRSESETREALANALSRLKRYESLYGPPSTFPPDQQTLLKRLTEKDESLRRVELQLTQEKAVYLSLDITLVWIIVYVYSRLLTSSLPRSKDFRQLGKL